MVDLCSAVAPRCAQEKAVPILLRPAGVHYEIPAEPNDWLSNSSGMQLSHEAFEASQWRLEVQVLVCRLVWRVGVRRELSASGPGVDLGGGRGDRARLPPEVASIQHEAVARRGHSCDASTDDLQVSREPERHGRQPVHPRPRVREAALRALYSTDGVS